MKLNFRDGVTFYDRAEIKAKDPKTPSKKKLRKHIVRGADLHKASGTYYEKIRILDKDDDSYLEEIRHPLTGELIHRCEERLTKHQGHGSAKSYSPLQEDAEGQSNIKENSRPRK